MVYYYWCLVTMTRELAAL